MHGAGDSLQRASPSPEHPAGLEGPGIPVTPRPAAVTTMCGFVAGGVPAQGQVAVVPPGRPSPARPPGGAAQPCVSHHGASVSQPRPAATRAGQGRSWGFVEVLIPGKAAACPSTAPQHSCGSLCGTRCVCSPEAPHGSRQVPAQHQQQPAAAPVSHTEGTSWKGLLSKSPTFRGSLSWCPSPGG